VLAGFYSPDPRAAVTRQRLGVIARLPEPLGIHVQAWRRALGDPVAGRIAPHLTLVPPQTVAERDLVSHYTRLSQLNYGVDTGFYVNVGPAGLYTASGLYHPGRPELQRVRAAVADPATGPELEAILRKAAGKGLAPYLDPLQRMPRPWPADHPRAELLKARSLVLNRQHERAPWLQTAELLDHLLADWKAMIPFNQWLERLP
jgi:hypothetical protein